MAEHTSPNSAAAVLTSLGKLLPDLEALYKDIHAHPELSMRETRTADIAADGLKKAGHEVTTGVGDTGPAGEPAFVRLQAVDLATAKPEIQYLLRANWHDVMRLKLSARSGGGTGDPRRAVLTKPTQPPLAATDQPPTPRASHRRLPRRRGRAA